MLCCAVLCCAVLCCVVLCGVGGNGGQLYAEMLTFIGARKLNYISQFIFI